MKGAELLSAPRFAITSVRSCFSSAPCIQVDKDAPHTSAVCRSELMLCRVGDGYWRGLSFSARTVSAISPLVVQRRFRASGSLIAREERNGMLCASVNQVSIETS